MDGDVEDLVQLLEDMARMGETLTPDIVNLPDQSGRVSSSSQNLVTISHPFFLCVCVCVSRLVGGKDEQSWPSICSNLSFSQR